MSRGFTLIELLVVIAMILVLSAAMTTSVAGAQRRAKISRAETEARELTNAILAFQNYSDDGTLSDYTRQDQAADEQSLDFVLGKVTSRGIDVPVLYNAGNLRDPWGHAYRVTIKRGETVAPPGVSGVKIRTFYPNWHRTIGGQ